MKKIVILLLAIIIITGCINKNESAIESVKEYLNNYQSFSVKVEKEIDDLLELETDMNVDQKEIYKEIFKRQFKDMEYKIDNESYEGDEASVQVTITVYDLFKELTTASASLLDNKELFEDQKGEFQPSLYVDYKLDLLKKAETRISYNIIYRLNKKDNKWEIINPSTTDLEKLEGIYAY